MYGDLDDLDRMAAALRDLAQEVRNRMSARHRQAQSATWRSDSAEEWRQRIWEECRAGDRVADGMDEAADALARHAQECRQRLAEIAAIEARVRDWATNRFQQLHAVPSELLGAAQQEAGRIREAIAALPPPGDLGWFDVPITMRSAGLW